MTETDLSSGITRHRSRTLSTNSQISSWDDPITEFDTTMEDTDMVELGMSHELAGDEVYLPSHPSRDWIRCFVSTSGAGSFRMYIEGKKRVRFLLSAKQFTPGGPIYISSSEEFPLLDTAPRKGYFARLNRHRDQSYLLYLNHCHLCDYRLGFFSCGGGAKEREVIARISHYYQKFRAISLDFKCIKVQLPAISRSGKRKIWCPRAFRNAYPNLPPDTTIESCIKDLDMGSAFYFRNELPEWNAEMKSLVVRFQGNRILTPSARNFMLVWAQDDASTTSSRSSSRSISPLQLRPDVVAGRGLDSAANSVVRPKRSPSEQNILTNTSNPSTPHNSSQAATPNVASMISGISTAATTGSSLASSSVDSPKLRSRSNTFSIRRANSSGDKVKDPHSEAVLQFGKSSPTRFTLDFRYPLSPLQAFGIALASFASEQNNLEIVTGDL